MRVYRRDRSPKNLRHPEAAAAFFPDRGNGRPHQIASSEHVQRRPSLEDINTKLGVLHARCGANETKLKGLFDEWDAIGEAHAPAHWLTLARIAELTLLTAGGYADGCEFQAAGDLLANPAKVLIHLKDRREPVCKPRHAALSTALRPHVASGHPFKAWYRANALRQVAQKALLPGLVERMATSGCLAAPYLDDFKTRMGKIADTIAFLSAWQIDHAHDLYARLQSDPDTRRFIEANLCRFGDARFIALGALIAHTQRSGVLCRQRFHVSEALNA